jgi:hypothetical protein
MLSFDQLKAERDALAARGGDVSALNKIIAAHELASEAALSQLKNRQREARLRRLPGTN